MFGNQGSAGATDPMIEPPPWWFGAIRRTVGLLGLVAAILALIWLPLWIASAMVGGAGPDATARGAITLGLIAVVGLFAAMIGLLGLSFRRAIRSPGWRLSAVLFLMVILFAVFGIDSTARVRSLPEASLSYPGATVVRVWASPAEGMGIDAPVHATLTREFETTARYSEVEAF